jgi:hypothetical protein
MSDEERERLYDWILKLLDPKQKEIEDVKIFLARFNPDNQYKITTNFLNKIETVNCFLHDGKYKTKRNTSLIEDYIINIEKIENGKS